MANKYGPENVEVLAHLGEEGSRHLLADHLLSVSEKASGFAGKLGLNLAGELVGLTHDLGKYSDTFQNYLHQMTSSEDTEQGELERGKVDHSTAGAQIIWTHLKPMGTLEAIAGDILALCVASHHSGLVDCVAPSGIDRLSQRMLKADLDTHREEAWSKADSALKEIIERRLRDRDLVESIKDKIASICRGERNEKIIRFKTGLLVRLLFSCLIDADRTDTADFSSPKTAAFRQHGTYVDWAELCGRLERELQKFGTANRVDRLRRGVSDDCLEASRRPRGRFTLTVPTGGGKTLASLRFALNHAAFHKLDRIIYVTPYTSIIDQNADVARKILEPNGAEFASIVLEHHSNLTPRKQTWRSKVLSENWDAPVVFTTMVQLLDTLFGSGTRAVRRMHQLANAVLIFDEIQTLPVRCVHLFNNAVNYLAEQCGSSVVLCTATQPLLHRVDPKKGAFVVDAASEIVRDVRSLFSGLKRCVAHDRRKAGGWEEQELIELAHSEAAESGSCLMVVNTKSQASSLFRRYLERTACFKAFHLSTNMCPAHRLEVLKKVKLRILKDEPVLCISTQLIEAGVDVDFGSVIRALAGLDSIAQAAGRCNRNGLRSMGRVQIVNVAGESLKQLPDIRLAQEAAQRVLDESSTSGKSAPLDFSGPDLIERYFEYYFFDRRLEMSYPVSAEKVGRQDTLLNMLGENRLAVQEAQRVGKKPNVFLWQSFMSAAKEFEPIESATRGVIVPYGQGGKAVIAEFFQGFAPDRRFALLRRAQQFTVNVFPHVMKRLDEAHALREVQPGTGVLCLDERFYSNQFGLALDGSEEMEFQNA